MKYIRLKNLIIFLLVFSLLQSEDVHNSEHLKTTIWFEKIGSSHIAIPLPVPVLPITIPILIPNNLFDHASKTISTGDVIIIQKKNNLFSDSGIFEYYDTQRELLVLKNNSIQNAISVHDITSIRLKRDGTYRAIIPGALLGLISGLFIGGIYNNSSDETLPTQIIFTNTIVGGLIGSLITIPKSRNIIRFNHSKYEYRVVYDE